MANPFDQIGSDIAKKQKPQRDQINITISKHGLERLVYIVIIVILATMVFINPFDKDVEKAASGNVVLEQISEPVEGIAEAEAKPVQVKAIEEPEIPEVTTDVEEEEETDENLIVGENFEFKILEVESLENDDGDKIKIDSITFKMVNNWKNFVPLIEVVWYDDESSNAIKEKVRTSTQLSVSSKGNAQTITLDKFDSSYYDPSNEDKEWIEVKLYDANSEDYLARARYSVTN